MLHLLDALDSDWMINIKVLIDKNEGWFFFKFGIIFENPESNMLTYLYKTHNTTC